MATTTLLEPEPSMLITGVGYAFSRCVKLVELVRTDADAVFVIDYATCFRGLAVWSRYPGCARARGLAAFLSGVPE